MQPLFPPYLDQGSFDLGLGPVWVLQLILCALGYETPITGKYDEATASAVRLLQAEMGIEQDGNFGPLTRKRFRWKTEMDIDLIPKAGDCAVMVKYPDSTELRSY